MARVVPSQVVKLIDRMFPDVKNQKEGSQKRIPLDHGASPFLAAITHLVDQIPSDLIIIDTQDYIEFSVSVAVIKEWNSHRTEQPLVRIPGHGELSPLTMIRRVLVKCRDEFPSPETAELNFIQDQEFRQNLRMDISATKKHISEGEWKSATVIAGSAIEALLLWALEERRREQPDDITNAITKLGISPGTNLDRWDLHTFVQVSHHLEIIGDDTATQAGLTRGFRNLIHPGRANRLEQKCDQGTALAAAAAIQFILRDLTH